MNRRLLLLSSVAVVLAAVLLLDRAGPPPVEPVLPASTLEPSEKPPAMDMEARLNPLEGLTSEMFPAILERPLFNPGRAGRGPEEPAPAPSMIVEQSPPPLEAQGPRAEEFTLVAISTSPSGRVAVMRVAATGEVLYLREGQPVQSWTVLSVRERSVVIGTAESSIELSLFPGGEVAGPAVPSAPSIEMDYENSHSEQMSPLPDSGGEQ